MILNWLFRLCLMVMGTLLIMVVFFLIAWKLTTILITIIVLFPFCLIIYLYIIKRIKSLSMNHSR